MTTERLIMITSGAYEGYEIECLVSWLTPKAPIEAIAEYKAELGPDHFFAINPEAFVKWLEDCGYANKVLVGELHLGSHTTFEEVRS